MILNVKPKVSRSKSSSKSATPAKKRKFDERFFVGAGCAHPNEKSLFKGWGATHPSPQTV
jgi:hypothetical protein